MQPDDLLRWRNALGLTQAGAAALARRGWQWVQRMEQGVDPIPRWLVYLTAWTRVHGPEAPWTDEDVPARMLALRSRWGFTQDDLCLLLDISRPTYNALEKGLPHRHFGVTFAMAWIALHGARLPLPSMPGDIRCPHCGRNL